MRKKGAKEVAKVCSLNNWKDGCHQPRRGSPSGSTFWGQGWEMCFGYAKLDIQAGMSSWQLDESEIPGEGSAGDKCSGAINYRY